VVAASLPESYLWQQLTRMRLTTNMRVQRLLQEGRDAEEQQAFADLLLAVGEGRAGEPFPIPAAMRAPTRDPKDLISSIFGDLGGSGAAADAARSRERLIPRALLTPRNEDVNALNDQVLASFPGGLMWGFLGGAKDVLAANSGSQSLPCLALPRFGLD